MITTEVAWRIRIERGLRLPVMALYENPRVNQIAQLQAMHRKAIIQLDDELHILFQQENEAINFDI